MQLPSRPPQLPDYSVRTSLRIPGAMLTGGAAWMCIYHAIPMFSRAGPIVIECERDRGWWLCEVSAWFVAHLPAASQGPFVGLAGFAAAGLCLYFTWLLLRPLIIASDADDKAADSPTAKPRAGRRRRMDDV